MRSATILLTLAVLAGTQVDNLVFLSTLSVSASENSSSSFKPLSSSILTVRRADDATIYMKATLGKVILVPVGTTGAAYTPFTTSLTDVYVTEAGKAPGSAALSAVVNSGTTTFNFEFSLPGGSGTNRFSLAKMLTGGNVGDGFGGAVTILNRRLSPC